MSGFMGAGDLYIDRDRQGIWKPLGNATTLDILPQGKTIERIGRGKANAGMVLDSTPIAEPSKLSIKIDEMLVTDLALALQGMITKMTGASGSIVDENVTVSKGNLVRLAHKNVSSVVVKSTDVTPITYVKGTDYVVSATVGFLETLESGSIADEEVVKVSYSYAAESGYKILGSTESGIRAALMLDGVNLTTGESVIVEVDEAILMSKTAVPFIATDKYIELQLEGIMRLLPGKTQPYTVEVKS